VREQRKTVRTPRTVFGGQAGNRPPQVTLGIITVCIGAFVLQLVLGDRFTDRFAYAPMYTLAEPWTMLTAAFLHSPSFLLHIVFNLYALWMIGPYLENLLGAVRFAAVYLLSALGGSVGYLVLAVPGRDSASWVVGTVGASGAIFGLFAALVLVNRRLGRDSAAIIGIIVLNAVLGFMVPNIAWQAHLGGLVTGALAAAVLAYTPAERRSRLHPLGLAALAGLLLAVTVFKIALVPPGLFV
jgi:membrane associated rhomboid family serine protease